MTFLELVKSRQSVRRFSNIPVDRKILDTCIEAARLAPSASNSQPWFFVIADEPELKAKIAEATYSGFVRFNHFTKSAGAMAVIVSEKPPVITRIGEFLKDKDYSQYDIGIAVEHFCLQATELGIGTCILGWFDENKIKEILNVPKNKRIELVIAIGYADKDELRKKIRKPVEKMSAYNRY